MGREVTGPTGEGQSWNLAAHILRLEAEREASKHSLRSLKKKKAGKNANFIWVHDLFTKKKKLLYACKLHLNSASHSTGKESVCNAGDPSLIPGSGSSPGEGIGYHSSILGLPWWLRW